MGERVILYEHGCPNCLRLKKKLDEKNIQYEDVTDKQVMLSLGFEEAPKLSVDGVVMSYKEAIKWIGEQ